MASILDLELTLAINELARRYETPRHIFQFFAVYGIYILAAVVTYAVWQFQQANVSMSATLKKFFLSLLLVEVIKALINAVMPRERPYGTYTIMVQARIDMPGGADLYHSMPSGHTLVAFLLVFTLQEAVNKFVKAEGSSQGISTSLIVLLDSVTVLSYLLALTIGISRVACGVHYLGDIIIAILISFLVWFNVSPWILSWFPSTSQ